MRWKNIQQEWVPWLGMEMLFNQEVVTDLFYDMRTPSPAVERRLAGYQQEVCGLKWSPDNQYPVSETKDSHLLVWNLRSFSPLQNYAEH
jgi:WD40 repeat protein